MTSVQIKITTTEYADPTFGWYEVYADQTDLALVDVVALSAFNEIALANAFIHANLSAGDTWFYWVRAAYLDRSSAAVSYGTLKPLGSITLSGAGSGIPPGGTAGQVLTKLSGADFDVDWEDPATSSSGGGGDLEFIATATPTATGAATFSSIPGTFRQLLLMGTVRSTKAGTGNEAVGLRFNGDTAGNYAFQNLYGTGGGASASQLTAQTSIQIMQIPTAGDAANYPSSFEIKIPQYAGTTFYKAALSHHNLVNGAAISSLFDMHVSGTWANTAAITQIDLFLASGNFVTGSEISLYGIA